RRGRCSRRSVQECRSFSFPLFGSVGLVILTLLAENGAVNSALDLEVGRQCAVRIVATPNDHTGNLGHLRAGPEGRLEDGYSAPTRELEYGVRGNEVPVVQVGPERVDGECHDALVLLCQLLADPFRVERSRFFFVHDLEMLDTGARGLVARANDSLAIIDLDASSEEGGSASPRPPAGGLNKDVIIDTLTVPDLRGRPHLECDDLLLQLLDPDERCLQLLPEGEGVAVQPVEFFPKCSVLVHLLSFHRFGRAAAEHIDARRGQSSLSGISGRST